MLHESWKDAHEDLLIVGVHVSNGLAVSRLSSHPGGIK
jgi:hypothetical protein